MRLVVITFALAAGLGFGAQGNARIAGPSHTIWFGQSLEGRPLVATELGPPGDHRTALVVGCIHGNECAGTAVALRLLAGTPPPGTDLWVVPDLNPDGNAAGTRLNADRVDLNRNFPWRWKRLKGNRNSGTIPLSEPESRAAYWLIRNVRPSVSIWFHQALDVVDDSVGDKAIEARFAQVARMRIAPLKKEPGSVVTWTTHCLPQGTAFVVELPPSPLPKAALTRLTRAVKAAIEAAPESRPALSADCVASEDPAEPGQVVAR